MRKHSAAARVGAVAAYTPAYLGPDLLRTPTAVEGERKLVTVLFCDLAGSTALAARVGAERMHALLDEFFAVAMAEVHRYEGTINQFLGDGFMALFGAPAAHEDHARRAALAALAIQHAARERQFERAGSIDGGVAVRMGLNTGEVIVGRIGDNLRMDYTAVGDTTNLAARMQQLAEPGAIYLSEATHRLIDSHVETTTVGERLVKGRSAAVRVFLAVAPRGPVDPQRAHHALSAPIVGRDDELNTLRVALDRLLAGRGSIVSVLGEAGVGKSRLMLEVSGARSPQIRWLEGRALSYGSTLSYWPFLEILRRAAGIADDDNEADSTVKLEGEIRRLFPNEVADILPYLATLLSLPIAHDLEHRVKYLDGHAMGRQVFRSVRLLVERLARERPLVLVFEDLHWADQSSLDLLEHIVPLAASVPLLFVLVARPERDGDALPIKSIASAVGDARYTEILLSQLSESSTAALFDSLVPGDHGSARLKHLVVQRAEGNPFFLEEIVRTLIADNVLEWHAADRRWHIAGRSDEIRLPDTVHGVVAARIDRLDAGTKQLLKLASVVGRSFFHRILEAAADAGDDLDGALRTLEASGLIRAKRRSPELEYAFKHAVVQEATYAMLLTPRRRELHQRVGDCIERLFADRLEDFYGVLAYHYARAEAWPKAQEYLFKAGDHAGRVAADAEALAHYQNAIAAYERVFGDRWDHLQRATVERKIGEALFRQGDHEQALSFVIAAKTRLHRPLTDIPKSPWGIRFAIAGQIARRICQPALTLVRKRQAEEIEPIVLDEISRLGEVTGWIDYFLNPERFLLQALTGLSYFERHPHAIGLIYNHMSIGLVCDAVSAFGLAQRHHRQALAIATECGQPIALGHAYLGSGIHAYSRSELGEALGHFEKSAAVFREIGHIRGWGGATMMRAWAYEAQGDFERALSYADSVNAVGEEASDPQVRAWGLLRRGASKRHLGRAGEAIGDLEIAIALSKQIPDYAGVVESQALAGLCHLDRGDAATARRMIDEANRIRRERNLRGIWVTYTVKGAAEVAAADGASG